MVVVPNIPHHAVQRGHNRGAVFVACADYAYYLDALCHWKRELDILVYAWCLITNSYLQNCCRYVELNPVKAGMVMRAEDYRWSSFRSKVGLEDSDILDHDPLYQAMSVPEKRD